MLVVIATVLLAFEFAFSKKYQLAEGTSVSAGLKFNAFSGLFGAVIFFILSGCKVEFSWFSLLLAIGMTVCAMAYSIIGFRVLKTGNMSIYSIFLMSGGMLLPYIFGVLFLNESLTWLRVVGIIIILIAVICFNGTKFKFKPSFFVLCLIVFFLNGMVSIISKCHQVAPAAYNTVNSTTFIVYSSIAKFIISSVALLFCKSERKVSFSSKGTLLIIVGAALIGGCSYMLQLIGAKELPATVLYPIVTGGSIIFSALSGRVFFKEKLSGFQIANIVLCFIGTLFFL